MKDIKFATFTLSGDAATLAYLSASLPAQLAADPVVLRCVERHRADALVYELDLLGGVPFPVFATASGQNPEIDLSVAYRDPESGREITVLIRNGAVVEKRGDEAADAPAYQALVRAGPDRRLAMALACEPWQGVWVGCVVAHDRDAYFKAIPRENGGALVHATGDDFAWSRRWMVPDEGQPVYTVLDEEEALGGELRRRLDGLSDALVADWLWFADGDPVEAKLEAQRYKARGWTVAAGNIKTPLFKRMGQTGDGGYEWDGLSDKSRWLADVLRRCGLGD